MAITGQRNTLYTIPNNPFYQVAGENVITIMDTSVYRNYKQILIKLELLTQINLL